MIWTIGSKVSGSQITVVIPVKNGLDTLDGCLAGILSQTLRSQLEVLVIDSGSTDGTLELIARYPVRIHRITPKEFNHGETRNLGVRLARGDFVVMTVQDARPADDRWLERMLKHFEDPNVAGVCGQQVVPHELDKNPLQWFRPYSQPVPRKILFANPTEFKKLRPAEQVALCGWDDVTAMYRRSDLVAIPFRRVNFSEDGIWAKDALTHGRALVYDYSARVFHYHNETFRFRFRRTYTIKYQLHRYFDHVTMPDWLLPRLVRQVYWSAKRALCPEKRASWCAYNMRLTLAEWLAGWCFWFACKCGGDRLAEQSHDWLCARPPQPEKNI
jgi:rhamnosyltransferase